MSVEDRLRETIAMTEEGLRALFEGTPHVVSKRFELLHRENELRNENMLTAIAKTKRDG
jgi:hypothetical protein